MQLLSPAHLYPWGKLMNIHYCEKVLKFPYVSRLLPLHQWIKINLFIHWWRGSSLETYRSLNTFSRNNECLLTFLIEETLRNTVFFLFWLYVTLSVYQFDPIWIVLWEIIKTSPTHRFSLLFSIMKRIRKGSEWSAEKKVEFTEHQIKILAHQVKVIPLK